MADKKMISKVVTNSVTVVRDGTRVTPKIGESFDFTKEESDYVFGISPTALRSPVNETKPDKAEAPVKETAAQKKKRVAAEKKAAEEAAAAEAETEEDESEEEEEATEDEDEDI